MDERDVPTAEAMMIKSSKRVREGVKLKAEVGRYTFY